MRLRPRNLEGAFPLLLIGGALLVYAAIIANQELATRSHLPFWGLIGGVGAVLVGAGIYSTFLEPTVLLTPDEEKDWVKVPKDEWEALRSGRRPEEPPARPVTEPPWWEGPPAPTPLPAPRPTPRMVSQERPRAVRPGSVVPSPRSTQPAPLRRDTSGGPPPSASAAPARPGPRSGPAPQLYRKGSLAELKEALTELESMVDREFKPKPRSPPKTRPGQVPSCPDCNRSLPNDPAPNKCSGCGRGLCTDCALSSQFEDGDLRCIECRARAS